MYKSIVATAGIFEFANNECFCVKDQIHSIYDGKEEFEFKIISKEGKIPFRHHFENGIKLKNDHGDDKHSPQVDIPHSQKYLDAIYEIDSIDCTAPLPPRLHKDIVTDLKLASQIEHYFNKYGFLFEINQSVYEAFALEVASSFFDRISTLITLMNSVDEIKPNYNKMFVCTFMLAMKQPSGFYTTGSKQSLLDYCEHPLYKAYSEIDFNKERARLYNELDLPKYFSDQDIDNALFYGCEEITTTPEEDLTEKYYTEMLEDSSKVLAATDEVDEIFTECVDPDDSEEILREKYEDFVDGADAPNQFIRPDGYSMIYAVRDYFLGEDTYNFIRKFDYDDETDEADEINSDERYIEKCIKYMYVHSRYSSRKEKLFFDFLYHYHFEVSKIKNINEQGLVPIELEKGINLNKNDMFDDRFKSCLKELANYTIKEELDYMVASVRPVYNAEKRSQGWYVKDLCTALYYSIFLTNRGTTVYRMCANPSCNRIFEVASTNARSKYHSLSCQRAMAQRFNRARLKQAETE